MSNYAALDTHRRMQTESHTHTETESCLELTVIHTQSAAHTHTHRETLSKSIGSSCDSNWDGDCDWDRDCDWNRDWDCDWGRDSSWDYIDSSGGSRWTVLVARLLQTDGRSWRKAAKRPQHILKDVRLSGQPECHLSHKRESHTERETKRERQWERLWERKRVHAHPGLLSMSCACSKNKRLWFYFYPRLASCSKLQADTGCSPAIVAALSEI